MAVKTLMFRQDVQTNQPAESGLIGLWRPIVLKLSEILGFHSSKIDHSAVEEIRMSRKNVRTPCTLG